MSMSAATTPPPTPPSDKRPQKQQQPRPQRPTAPPPPRRDARAPAPPPSSAPSRSSPDAAAAADRARRRTNYKNDWQRRKDSDLAPQVVLSSAFPTQDARVAIIGGGIAGLVCARELARLGVRSTVFDTGERGPGGRLATRTTADGSFVAGAAGAGSASAPASSGAPAAPSSSLAFDHAAQFFTASTPEFASMAQEWLRRGWVREWAADRVVRLRGGGGGGGASREGELPRPPYYVPASAGGFRALARALADDAVATGLVEMRCGAWVSRLEVDRRGGEGEEKGGSKWRAVMRGGSGGGGGGGGKKKKHNTAACDDISSSSQDCGVGAVGSSSSSSLLFDAVVIAHNGKCANRLAAPMGSPLVARQLMRLRLSAAWVAMLAFERPLGPLGLSFEGAFVGGGGGGGGNGNGAPAASASVLAWAANNTAKLGLNNKADGAAAECWTLVSTDSYAQRRKVPQERVPADVAAAVARELSEALASAAGLEEGGLPALAAPPRVQLWGAALPLNSPGVPAILDPAARVGVCGDWLLGAGVQSAARSGLALARRLAALRGVSPDRCAAAVEGEDGEEESLAVGLRAAFAPLGARSGGCGEFPSSLAAEEAGVEARAATR
jgi:predicted NAD/FAD-dependent oxidoreductase